MTKYKLKWESGDDRTIVESDFIAEPDGVTGARVKKDLRGISFRRAVLVGLDLRWANLEKCNFECATLVNCDLDNAILLGAGLDDVTFVRCSLRFIELGSCYPVTILCRF